jgi:hypothetical protein
MRFQKILLLAITFKTIKFKGVNTMKAKASTKTKAPKAAKTKAQPKATPNQSAMDKFKFEVANELGIPLKQGYNGDLTSKQTGYVGGYMVKKMIEAQGRQMGK